MLPNSKEIPPPPFSHIHLSCLRIQDGLVQVDRPQQHQIFQDITAQLNLTIQAPGRPQQTVQINQGSIGLTSPPYPRLQADLGLTFSPQEIHFQKTAISLADITVLNLQGKIINQAAAPDLALNLKTPELSGPRLCELWPRWPRYFQSKPALKSGVRWRKFSYPEQARCKTAKVKSPVPGKDLPLPLRDLTCSGFPKSNREDFVRLSVATGRCRRSHPFEWHSNHNRRWPSLASR